MSEMTTERAIEVFKRVDILLFRIKHQAVRKDGASDAQHFLANDLDIINRMITEPEISKEALEKAIEVMEGNNKLRFMVENGLGYKDMENNNEHRQD